MRKLILTFSLAIFTMQHVNATPPEASISKYFKTISAGFMLEEGEGVLYMIKLALRKKVRKDMYATAFFENPLDSDSPMRFDFVLEKGDKDIVVRSPIIKKIKNVKSYKIEILLYKNLNKTKLVNTHIQMIQFALPSEIASEKRIKLISSTNDSETTEDLRVVGWSIRLNNNNWQKASNQINADQSIIEYIPLSESLNNWSKMISSHIIYTNIKNDWLYNYMIKELEENCPSFSHKILNKSSDEILFEWNHSGCNGKSPQHELRKIVNANGFIYTLSVSLKGGVLTNKDKKLWIEKMESASTIF